MFSNVPGGNLLNNIGGNISNIGDKVNSTGAFSNLGSKIPGNLNPSNLAGTFTGNTSAAATAEVPLVVGVDACCALYHLVTLLHVFVTSLSV